MWKKIKKLINNLFKQKEDHLNELDQLRVSLRHAQSMVDLLESKIDLNPQYDDSLTTIVVCGDNYSINSNVVTKGLNFFNTKCKNKIQLIIDGSFNRGIDSVVRRWADENKVNCIECTPMWLVYGNKAGIYRNRYVLRKYKPKYVITFSSNGTFRNFSKLVPRQSCFLLYGQYPEFKAIIGGE